MVTPTNSRFSVMVSLYLWGRQKGRFGSGRGRSNGPGVGKIGFFGPPPTATFLDLCEQASPQAVAASAASFPLQTGTITVTDHS